jgi:hypothetical protein
LKRLIEEGPLLDAAGDPGASTGRDAIRARLRRFFRAQPSLELVSRSEAARILGVQSPHLSREWLASRLPAPVPVRGSAPVYVKAEIQALAAQLRKERLVRARKRAKKEDPNVEARRTA